MVATSKHILGPAKDKEGIEFDLNLEESRQDFPFSFIRPRWKNIIKIGCIEKFPYIRGCPLPKQNFLV